MVKNSHSCPSPPAVRERRRKTQREKYLDQGQFEALVKAGNRCTYAHAGDLFRTAGFLGLRLGEAIALRRQDFRRLADNIIEVETLKQRDKGEAEDPAAPRPVHPIACGDAQRRFFQGLLAALPAGEDYLFPGRRPGAHISKTHAERVFHECARAAGLGPEFTFHALRHHRGVMLWSSSKDLQFVREQLRHKSIKSTEIYVHMDESEKVKLAKDIDAKYNL